MFILCLVFATNLAVSDEIKKPKGGNGSRTNDIFSAQYSFTSTPPSPLVESKQGADNNSYLIYSFDRNSFTTDIGKPQLPYYTEYVYLPDNADSIGLEITQTSEETQDVLNPIYPVDTTQWTHEANGVNIEQKVFTLDNNAYSTPGYYPTAKAVLGPVTLIRGLHYIPVKIYPIQYDPVARKLNLTQSITLKLTWTQKFSTTRQAPTSYGNQFNQIITGLNLHNFTQSLPVTNQVNGLVSRPTDLLLGTQTDYIIITADNFYLSSPVDDLANYRASTAGGGYNVSIVRTQDIYNTNFPDNLTSDSKDTRIKRFLKYAYTNWNGINPAPQFALIIGDAITDDNDQQVISPTLVPTHLSTYAINDGDGDGKTDRIATDYWYSCLSSSSYLDEVCTIGDILIGRFPIQTETELARMVNKTKNYETTFAGTWRSQIELLNGFDIGQGGMLTDAQNSFKSMTDNYLLTFPLEEDNLDRSALAIGIIGREDFRTQMKAAINSGRHITVMSTHGSRITFADGVENNIFCGAINGETCNGTTPSDIPQLTNSSTPTLFLATSCQTAWFDDNTLESLGENMVEGSDSGAVAYLGASRDVMSADSFPLIENAVNELVSKGNTVLGSAILQSKAESNLSTEGYLLENLLGDPALNIGKMMQPSPKPDLTVKFINYSTTTKTVTIHTTVKNSGTSSLSNVLLQLWNGAPHTGGQEVTEVRIPTINADQEIPQDISLTIPSLWANGINLYLSVDETREIDELSESNNMAGPFYFALNALQETYIGDGSNPKIQGQKIVYTDPRNNRTDVYLFDLNASEEINITGTYYTSLLRPSSAGISGAKITWRGMDTYTSSTTQVYVRDALSDGIFDSNDIFTQVSQHIFNSDANTSPTIYGNKILWTNILDSVGNIYLSDAGANGIFGSEDIETPVKSSSAYQNSADIYDNKVVWQDERNGYLNKDIYLYDLDTKLETQITTNTSTQQSAKISQNNIVWTDYRNSTADIYLYDLDQNREFQMTSHSTNQFSPVINDNKIVWIDSRDGSYDYYLKDIGPDGQINTGDDAPERRVEIPPVSYRSAPSLDGNRIVYSETVDGRNRVYMIDLEDFNRQHVYVPAHYSTIQAAIDSVEDGNTIHVASGIYNESIDFRGKNIYLIADNGPGATTIQGQVYIHTNEGLSATVDGFNIFNTQGSAFLINGASPTIENCVINSTAANGIGIDITNGSPLIKSNKIQNSNGYGVKATGTFAGEISNNTITGNHNSGIYLTSASGTSSIHNNLIKTNTNYGIFIENTSAINSAVSNNTIVSNTAGGIKLSSSSNVSIKNNIISSNAAYGIYALSSTGLTSTYNDIYNQTTNSSGVSDGTGVIHSDPKYDGSSNLLQSTSPCINTGDVALKDNDGTRLDMGAFFYPVSSLAKNASFETDNGTDYYSSWNDDDKTANNNLADGWTNINFGVNDATVNFGGAKSLKINVTNNRGFSVQDIPVVNGKTYHVSGHVKTDCSDSNCYGTILTECLDSGHLNLWGGSCNLNTKADDIVRLYGDNDWTKIEYDVTADNPNAQYLRLICYNTPNDPYQNPPNASPMGTGTVWCDSMSVTEVIP